MAAKVKLNLPVNLWTQKDSKILGLNTLASIKLRTSKGMGYKGKFTDYSVEPIYVGLNSDTGKRLKPKGGRKTPKSRFYEGGYAEYKEKSRKRRKGAGNSAAVDLVLSGQLMNNFVLKKARPDGFTLGLTKHVSHYGYDVNKSRPFIGLTKKDIDILVKAVTFDLKAKLEAI